MVYGCTVVFNNTLKQLYSKIPAECILTHDYTLSTIASGLGKVHFDDTKEPQIMYRQHGNNTIGYYNANFKNFIKSIKSFFSREVKSVRFKEVLNIKKSFYDQLSLEDKHLIDLITTYKFDKSAKKELKKFIKDNVTSKFVKSYTLNLLRFKKL